MTRKLLSVLLALVMVLCFMPTIAFAEDAHTHCVCGGEHSVGDHTTHTDVMWTGVSDLSEIAAAGNYYLKNDVTLSNSWTCTYDIYLCLGGKTITGKDGAAVINVASGASLAITDCGTSGKITHAEGAKGRGIENNGTLTLWNGTVSGNSIVGDGGGVYVSAGCTFTMYGGSISGNSAVANKNWNGKGGGVCVDWSDQDRKGIFNMHGGSITGNTATNSGGGVNLNNYYCTFTMTGGSITNNTANLGGGVWSEGTFTMNGGSVTNNTATNNCGGVYNDGTFTMNNGTISGNTATNNGGGVYNDGTFTMNDGTISGNSVYYEGGGVNNHGTFTMNDGTINGNSATNGGGVYNDHRFTMHNGTISGNTATNDGGGVYSSGTDARLTMNGGSISGNTATNNGGGVASWGNETEFAMNGGTISGNTATNGGGVYADFSGYNGMFTVSGTPVISGNVKGGTITDGELQGGTVNNLYLPSGKTVTVESGKPLTEGAMIGVTTGSTPTAGNPVVITSGSADKDYFQSDDDTYDVGTDNDGKVVLQLHSFGGDYLHDETGHWQVCQNDGCTATTAKTAHSGGTTTCKDKAVCEICNEEYGDLAPHELTHNDEKPATAIETGNTEYWHCDVCDKYFSDENAENEINLTDTVVSKLAPKIIAGDGAAVTEGEKKALSFTSDAAFDDFLRVEVDGKTVNESSYTVKSGSTVVTLNADYVATLSVGEHTLGIVSESGTATAKFTVNKKAAETTSTTNKPDANNDTTSPKTGDNSNLVLWIALLLISGSAVIGTTVVSKKKKYNR